MTDIAKIRMPYKSRVFSINSQSSGSKLGHRISAVLILHIISSILWKWRKNLKGSTLKIKNLKNFLKKSYKICPTAKVTAPNVMMNRKCSREFLILKILKCEMAKINWPLSIYKNILRIWFSVFRLLPFCITWWFLTSQTKPVYK